MVGMNVVNCFEREISFLDNWLAYEDADELENLENITDACTQISGMYYDYDGDDFPENLKTPEIMMLCWNFVVYGKKHGTM